jgi:hypothetical protein
MFKCDRCIEKVRKGETPACISACPQDVQKIGPRDEIIREAKDKAREEGCFLYGRYENGGTNTIYLSPVPFDQMDRILEKGPGRPHLRRAEDRMAAGNYLSLAMIIAPLAGIAAAVGKNYRALKHIAGNREEKD